MQLLSASFGAADTKESAAASQLWLTQAVRRLRQPGCPHGPVLVLQGANSAALSSALRILAGNDAFSDQDILALDARSQMEALSGAWLYLFDRIEERKSSELSRLDAFVARRDDSIRPADPRNTLRRPRQCSFVLGMDGEATGLPFDSGHLLLVESGAIDLDRLRRDRDQLWAEAVTLERDLDAPRFEELKAVAGGDGPLEHPWLEPLRLIMGHRMGAFYRISSEEVFQQLGILDGHKHPHYPKQLGSLMRRLGWSGPRKFKQPGGVSPRGYERPADRD